MPQCTRYFQEQRLFRYEVESIWFCCVRMWGSGQRHQQNQRKFSLSNWWYFSRNPSPTMKTPGLLSLLTGSKEYLDGWNVNIKKHKKGKGHFNKQWTRSLPEEMCSPKAEIKNESVTPALKQTHTEKPSAVQCKVFLRNSVSMITEIGAQVSEEFPPPQGAPPFILKRPWITC